MAYPKVGAKAPEINLLDDEGKKFKLADLKGSSVVVYFYPKADTPGCTVESCEFRDAHKTFAKKKAVIVGVSPDTPARQEKFKTKFGFPFKLLADTEHAAAEAYGVWQEKSMYGRKYFGIARTTFLIGPDGKIRNVFEKVKPKGHAGQVLDALAEL
jgi:peroxiredoxin Q/BCP